MVQIGFWKSPYTAKQSGMVFQIHKLPSIISYLCHDSGCLHSSPLSLLDKNSWLDGNSELVTQ